MLTQEKAVLFLLHSLLRKCALAALGEVRMNDKWNGKQCDNMFCVSV